MTERGCAEYAKELSMIQRAVLLSTGDEITTGKVVDSNSSYIAAPGFRMAEK
jgi:hypothetical protein